MDVSAGMESSSRRDSEGDMVFYVEEPRAGSCHPCKEGVLYSMKEERSKASRQKLKEMRKVWYSGR